MNMHCNRQMIGRLFAITIAVIFCRYTLNVLRPLLSSTDTYEHEMEQLDKKRANVSMLVTASSLTSALISAIPDDTATPIANQLAEFSKLFIVIMTVLLAEKYLLTVFGIISAYLLVLSSILSIIYNCGYKREWLYNTIIKIVILAIACGSFIPVSIRVTDMIEETHSATIEQVISRALENEAELRTEEQMPVEDKNLWGKITSVFNNIGDTVSEVVETES